jgi:hypothetical protein
VVTYDARSFSAGQACGTRVAGCVARLAALELIADERWWSRWRRRSIARALITLAEEMEGTADANLRESA